MRKPTAAGPLLLHERASNLRARVGVPTRMPPPLPTPAAPPAPRPAWNTNHNLVVTHPLLSLLESCASFRRLLQLHALLTVSGLAAHRFPASRLLAFCALSDPPRLAHAAAVLAQAAATPPGPNAYMLATMMRAFLRAGLPRRALALFRRVLRDRLPADARTFVFALKAAAAASSPGEAVHCVALKRGFLGQSALVGNALMHLYASGVSLSNARKVFDEMPDRDVVSWTTLVDGYARGGVPEEAWRVFCRMVVAGGGRPNGVTLVAAASAVGQMGLLGLGRTVRRYVAESGVSASLNLENALVDMFGKCGCVASAKEVFDGIAVKDVYSWTSMMSAYAKCGDLESAVQMFEDMPLRNAVSWSCMIATYLLANQPEEAVRMFNDMIATGMEPIDATLVSVLSACAQLGCLDLGRWIYDHYIVGNKVRFTVNLGNALIDMFAKCGDVGAASRLFGNMEERNLVSWNSMIMAHALHSQSEEALRLFQQFKETGIVPDEITYIGVLSACSHSGLVSEGRCRFKEMKMVYGIEPRAEHYACLIDLLGKVGLLEEAFEVARSMPMGADEAGWGALLNACRMHGNVEIGECAADKLVGLDPADSGIYILMSQIYASKSKWDLVKMLRTVMRDRGVKKNPGYSSIEVDGKFHEFLVADVSHVRSEDIYAALKNIYIHLKSEGYIPFS
ncbi:pentatricopeptide repeat-containing protein At2g22410, mitochondrial-like [Phragmites australis]|uniref:pentatricopeptide repeat-containing protein At2g22410, mitochondrial-like n=1 Tax=Phragmites australis TaxID=29695 RepID=UPI002D78925C|nr:pentatricopeptide repeat-containing protein At2g22410, mitochondrial-like [Phragmites australis]XP_062204764.1 pentatricopeptide repeat-containing protein At2g22410, mitochondrial-like [Phragmites australis]